MRKLIIFTLTVACAGIQTPERAQAGAFATEFTQLLNNAQLVMSYLRQGQQLVNELNMYGDMVRNVKNIPNQVFGPYSGRFKRARSNRAGRTRARRTRWEIWISSLELHVPRLPNYADGLLHELQELVADVVRHDARHPSRRRFARSAVAERTGNHQLNPKYVPNGRWPDAGAQCNESSRRAAGPAAYEASRVDARGHVEQAGLSSRHDPAAIGERSGNGMVLLNRPGDKQWRHLLAWALMVLR